MKLHVLAMAALALCACASDLPSQSTSAQTSEGRLLHPAIALRSFEGDWRFSDGHVNAQRFHILEVDLTHPDVSVRVSGEHLPGERWTSTIATDEGAFAAVNANYSSGTFVRGYAVSDGVPFSSMRADLNSHAIGWRDGGGFTFFDSAAATWAEPPADFPHDLDHATSGCGRVAREGVACDGRDPRCGLPGCTNPGHAGPNPRTLIGVDEAQARLFLVAVDGRDGIDGDDGVARGMTLRECATFMVELGAHDAVNLDGGGSTTMWTEATGVVNAPSNEQPERGVPSAVLVHVDGN